MFVAIPLLMVIYMVVRLHRSLTLSFAMMTLDEFNQLYIFLLHQIVHWIVLLVSLRNGETFGSLYYCGFSNRHGYRRILNFHTICTCVIYFDVRYSFLKI